MFYPSLASANLPITVLKFGGSVLAGPDALSDVVSEIERTVRLGRRIVTVTSAFAGVTSRVIVYRSGLTKGTGVLSGARRIDVTMSITRIPL